MGTKRSMGVAVVCLAIGAGGLARAQEPPRTDGWVVVGLEEYRALRARAFPSVPDPLPPPVDATLTRVDYELRVNGDTVAGEARLTVDVIKQGWVSIQMPAGMLVRGARLEGRTTALVDGNPPRVLISRNGRSVLSLDVVVPINSSGGIESMTLPPSASALSAVTLIVPRTGLDLTVAGGFVAEQAEANAENRWTVYGTPGQPLTFSWKRKLDERRQTLPMRARTRITEVVALGEDTSQVTASIRVDISQGLAREVVLSMPEAVAVNNVTGATVADWRYDKGALTVTFLEPVAATTSFVVSGETRAPRDGVVGIPIVRMPAAERETGGIAVDVIGAGEVTERQARGFEPADPSDLGDIVEGRESPSMVAFVVKPIADNTPRTLTVTVTRFTDKPVLVANVEEARYDALIGEDGKVLVRARYAVRNNQRAFLALKLPPQATLWSAALAGRPVRPGLSSDGGYLMPLQKGRSGETPPTFMVELVYFQRTPAWTVKGDSRLELPAVDLPVSRTGLTVHYSPRFQVEPLPGTFRSDVDPGPSSTVLRSGAETPQPTPTPSAPNKARERDLEGLMDRFRKEVGRTSAGVIPVDVIVPALGPSFFAAAELTAEMQAPAIDLKYKRAGDK